MMRYFSRLQNVLLVSLLLFLPVLCAAAEPQPEELNQVFARLKAAAEETKTLSSSFVQEKHLAIFSEQLLSQGRFVYQKPDQLRWELLTPATSGFVLNGAEGVRWNGLSKETNNFSTDRDPLMGMIARQLFAWAQLDIEWLLSRYQIELINEQPVQLKLIPLDQGEAGFIEHLQIRFAADQSYVETVEMNEKGGDKTLLHFKDVQLNRELTADAFKAPRF